MLLIIISMSVGIVLGYTCFPSKWNKLNHRIQITCTAVLIFSMGVMLGQRPNFINELVSLGISSIIFSIIPIICSVVVVFVLTKKFMSHKDIHNDSNCAV